MSNFLSIRCRIVRNESSFDRAFQGDSDETLLGKCAKVVVECDGGEEMFVHKG